MDGDDRWTGRQAEVGGTAVRRTLPQRRHRTVGAWCFVDHYGPTPAAEQPTMAVGPHPHIGLHTVTWLLEGEAVHTDSLGSEQPLRPGQLNVMTAGRGIAHAEDSARRGWRGGLHGVQLWVAQPDATRNGPPRFEHHAELPGLDLGGARASVLVGTVAGTTSPARTDTDLVGLDLALDGGVELPLAGGHEHALVPVAGAVTVDGGDPVAVGELAYLAPGRSSVDLGGHDARLLVLGGEPLGEEIHMWWNFVARTVDEVREAADDWNAGSDRFGTVDSTLDRIPAPVP